MGSDGGVGGAGNARADVFSELGDSHGGDSSAASSFSEVMDDAGLSAPSELSDEQPDNEDGDGDGQGPGGTQLGLSVDDEPSISRTSWRSDLGIRGALAESARDVGDPSAGKTETMMRDGDITDPAHEVITVADNKRINKSVPSDRFDDLKAIREEDRARDLRRGGRLRVRDMSEDSLRRIQERVTDQKQWADDLADIITRQQEMKEQELEAQKGDELDAGIPEDSGTKEPADR